MSDSIDHAVASRDHQNDQIQDFGLKTSQMRTFGGILRAMNLEAIPAFASTVRQFGHYHAAIASSKISRVSASISCKILTPPLYGSFHIVFTLEFDDGVKWMLKVPANGHRFDSVAAAALISEARTMQLIKRETTIPIPAVYAFESSSSHQLRTPFILMERMDGQPLYRSWYDNQVPKARLEHFRGKVLQSLAAAMAQLNKFTLSRGGALVFDKNGKPFGLRGAKVVDEVAVYNLGEDDEDDEKDDQDTTDQDITIEKGPFECPKSAFVFDLDRAEKSCESDVYTRGCYKALRMFVDLAFSKPDDHGKGFVLTHPDFNLQNVLVADDGTLLGLIDWDGVGFVPREIGCAQYPFWLMSDWVPYDYLYDIQKQRPKDDADYEESSPAELASCRALYAHFMEKEIERHADDPQHVTTVGTSPKQEAQLTRRSLVMKHLDLAATSPFLTADILCHIFRQIERVTEPEWGSLDLGKGSECSSSRKETVNGVSDHEDAFDQVTEVLAEISIQPHDHTVQPSKNGQALSDRQLVGIEASEVIQKERPKNIPPTQSIAKPDPTQNVASLHATKAHQDTHSARDTIEENLTPNSSEEGSNNEDGNGSDKCGSCKSSATSLSEERDDDEDVRTFKDDGEFRSRNIFMLLGMDMLDEKRLLRLQKGFLMLLEHC